MFSNSAKLAKEFNLRLQCSLQGGCLTDIEESAIPAKTTTQKQSVTHCVPQINSQDCRLESAGFLDED